MKRREQVSVRFAPFSASADSMAHLAGSMLAIQLNLAHTLAQAAWQAQADYLRAMGQAVIEANLRAVAAVLAPRDTGLR